MKKRLNEIKVFSDLLGYSFSHEDDYIQIWAESKWFLVKIDFEDNDTAFVSIVVRGNWIAGTNTTECIEFLTIYLLLFLNKTYWCSPYVIGLPHPAVEGELHALCIAFKQSKSSLYSFDQKFTSEVKSLLNALKIMEYGTSNFFGCDQCSCEKELKEQYEQKLENWKRKITKLSELFPYLKNNYCITNHCPPFMYSYIIPEDTVIISNSVLAEKINNFPSKIVSKKIVGLSGSFLLVGDLKHYISDDEEKKHKQIMKALDDNVNDIHFYLGENYIISVGHEIIIMSPSSTSGKYGFEAERMCVQKQKDKWSVLFSKNKYLWSDQIDDDLFELFSLDLLKLETSTIWARKAGHSRDSDFGKDIILERNETDIIQNGIEVEYKIVKKTIIVQCKASNKNIGKAQVQDIRDTIDFHDADGFLLITSSRITSALVDHLFSLKNKKSYLIEWWTRDEIEDRLDKYPELLNKYDNIVKLVK